MSDSRTTTRLDLERARGPRLDLFPRLQRAADAGAFQLTPAQVAAFERDGWLAPVPVLDQAQVAELRRRLDALCQDLPRLLDRLYEVERAWLERPGQVVCHFLGGWLVDDALHDLVFAPPVTVPAAQLLGLRRLRFWHDQAFVKPARHPAHVPWHQDYSYWTRTAPPCHVTAHIALDDADPANGCLQVVPGSHRLGLLPKVPFDAPKDAVLAALAPAERAALRVAVPVRLRAGEASFHHSHLLHGSDGNQSPRPRRALVLNYMGPDTRSADGSAPLLAHTPSVPQGAVIDGPHFPIVLDLDAR